MASKFKLNPFLDFQLSLLFGLTYAQTVALFRKTHQFKKLEKEEMELYRPRLKGFRMQAAWAFISIKYQNPFIFFFGFPALLVVTLTIVLS